MPHFFTHTDQGLDHFEANGDAVVLAHGVIARRAATPAPPRPDAWLLLVDAASSARVNGVPVATGLALLDDRDEIVVADGSRFLVSFEEIAAVEPFPLAKAVPCARCRLPIEPGTPGVRCPLCAIWAHQSADRECFTYAEHCAVCAGPTELGGALAWIPEDIA